jgi:hypothetical protein
MKIHRLSKVGAKVKACLSSRHMRLNQPIVGLFIGLIMPLFGFIVVYFVMGRGMSFNSFSEHLQVSNDALSKVISLSVLANLLPFLYFNRRRLDQGVKGIVIATMLYAVAFLYVKFVA